MNYLEMHH